MFGTLFFVSMYLQIKYNIGAKEDLLNALAVALTFYGMQALANDFSGACFNPIFGLV